MNNIKILRAGLYTTVQDMRRIGYKRYGIPDSGPMDEYSHVLANWLVGKNYLLTLPLLHVSLTPQEDLSHQNSTLTQ